MITIYSKPQCVSCEQTKKWLERNGLEYKEEQLADHPDVVEEVKASGFTAAPICVTDQGAWWAGLNLGQLKAYKAAEQYKKETAGGVDIPIGVS